MIRSVLMSLMLVLMMVTVSPARVIDDVNLPETLTFDDHLLMLNGGGTRVAFLNDVYVAGLWLERAMTDPAAVKDADEAMAIRMHVVNDFFASNKHITKAFNNGFRNSMPRGDISSIQSEVDQFKSFFSGEIKDEDEFDIVYIPGKGTSVYKNTQYIGMVPGYEFKKCVWSIWMHDTRPADEDLKEGMVAGTISAGALQAREQFVASAKKIAAEKAKAAEVAAKKAAETAKAKAGAEAKAIEAAAMQTAADAKEKTRAKEKSMTTVAAEVPAKVAAGAVSAAAGAAAVGIKRIEAAPAVKPIARSETSSMKTAAEETMNAAIPTANDDIFFDVNSAALSSQARKVLAGKAKWMKANPIINVDIEVFCDSRGSKEYNMMLAQKRGESVLDFMTAAGIDDSRMNIVIVGAVDSAAGETAYANNRRAHFKIKWGK